MDPVWGWIARLTLAALFAAAGLSKLYRPAAFRAAVADYDLVPARAVAPVALALASAEVAGALLLLVPATRMAGASLLWAMLALFSAAIAISIRRGRLDIDCGCWLFGAAHQGAQRHIGWPTVARNGGLAALVLVAVLPGTLRPLDAIDWLTVSAGASAVLGLFAIAAQLGLNGRLLAGLKAAQP